MSSKDDGQAGHGLFVISAPSGAGKTSLVHALLARDPQLRLSVSSTTRPARPGENDGDHYHFIAQEDFEAAMAAGEFLEHAQVFDYFYGTRRQHVQALHGQGFDVILEIDWQGAGQIRHQAPDCLSIFILPPSLDALQKRLQSRGQDRPEVIARRMRDARNEMSHYAEFDYLVVNDEFDQALNEISAIIQSWRLRRPVQQARHRALLRDLLE